MRLILFASTFLVFAFGSTVYGQSPAPIYTSPAPGYAATMPVKTIARANDEAPDGRAQHLVKAAEHLEAAGMKDDAAQLRQMVQEAKQSEARDLLAKKISELDRLQSEVDELRRATGQFQQIMIHVQVLQVDRTKLRQLGIEFDVLAEHCTTLAPLGIVKDESGLVCAIEALRKQGLLKVLAEPTLVTVHGRPAFFNAGGEFPTLSRQSDGSVSIEHKKFGTQMELVAHMLGGGRLRLEICPRISELDFSRSVKIGDVTVPGLNVCEVDTRVEMSCGQTVAIAGLVQNRVETTRLQIDEATKQETESVHEIETIFLVTPKLVDAKHEGLALPRPEPLPKPTKTATRAYEAPK